jgi:hypothetical protein
MSIFNYEDSDFDDIDSEEEEYIDEDILIYNCEEPSVTRYNIVLCELYNERFHGNGNKTLAKYHYLVAGRFKKFYVNYINKIKFTYNLNLEIAECFDLETQERVAIIKTIWIKLIQRTWKNILKKRADLLIQRSHPSTLRYRELYGKWPKESSIYPTLKGMLKLNVKNIFL